MAAQHGLQFFPKGSYDRVLGRVKRSLGIMAAIENSLTSCGGAAKGVSRAAPTTAVAGEGKENIAEGERDAVRCARSGELREDQPAVGRGAKPDCGFLPREPSPEAPVGRGPGRVLLFIDWDDTLCPTTWLEERSMLGFGGPAPGAPSALAPALAEQARAVNRLLGTALALGDVVLVTLAERPWVASASRDFMPEATLVAGLAVFYASEGADSDSLEGVEHLSALKRRSMQQAVETLRGKFGEGTTWESLISIGDSEAERLAAQDLSRSLQAAGVVKWSKTVKLAENPDIEELTSQVRTLDERLAGLVAHPGNKHITGQELMSPPERLVGLKGHNKILW